MQQMWYYGYNGAGSLTRALRIRQMRNYTYAEFLCIIAGIRNETGISGTIVLDIRHNLFPVWDKVPNIKYILPVYHNDNVI